MKKLIVSFAILFSACLQVRTTPAPQPPAPVPAPQPQPTPEPAPIPQLPSVPSRADILNVHITFQGLRMDCPPLGTIPLFEAGLPWVSAPCRANIYAAKHASDAWAGGDTHAMFMVPSGAPLYDEPNQPYNRTNFPSLDWTNGGKGPMDLAFIGLVEDILLAGNFNRILIFEGGDAGEQGFPIAMNQLDMLYASLATSDRGDLRPYVVIIPGFDGVFYGYTQQHLVQWLTKCKSLFPYCGLEHSTGHIPMGNGPADYHNGPLSRLDLLLSEFNDDQYDDTIWQVSSRLLGPAYHRPSDQPATDDPHPPYYLGNGTVACAFEFHEYRDVHFGTPTEFVNTVKQRNYLKGVGFTCGG